MKWWRIDILDSISTFIHLVRDDGRQIVIKDSTGFLKDMTAEEILPYIDQSTIESDTGYANINPLFEKHEQPVLVWRF